MNSVELYLVRRYALAFLSAFRDELSFSDIEKIKHAGRFFKEHKAVVYFLRLPGRSMQIKKELIKKLFERVHMPACLQKLVELLSHHKRLSLLPNTLELLIELYQESQGIMTVRVSSSSLLHEEQIKALEAFFAHKSAKRLSCSYTVDTSLIAGIRLQSNALLWEYSVRKKLREMRTSVLR